MPHRLSERQRECLSLTRLMSDKEIARQLGISESTVKKHVFEACQRLNVNRRKAALGILERNVPGPTSHPIPTPASARSHVPIETGGIRHGGQKPEPSTLDLDGSGNGTRAIRGRSGPHLGPSPLYSGAQNRCRADDAGAVAQRGSRSGGPAGQPRWGYLPPPRSLLARLVLILVFVALTSLVLSSVGAIVTGDQHRLQAVDRAP